MALGRRHEGDEVYARNRTNAYEVRDDSRQTGDGDDEWEHVNDDPVTDPDLDDDDVSGTRERNERNERTGWNAREYIEGDNTQYEWRNYEGDDDRIREATDAVGQFAFNQMSNPGRWSTDLMQQGMDTISASIDRMRQRGQRGLSEAYARRGITGSSVEAEAFGDYEGELQRLGDERAFELAREVANTSSDDAWRAYGMGSDSADRQFGQYHGRRSLDIQERQVDEVARLNRINAIIAASQAGDSDELWRLLGIDNPITERHEREQDDDDDDDGGDGGGGGGGDRGSERDRNSGVAQVRAMEDASFRDRYASGTNWRNSDEANNAWLDRLSDSSGWSADDNVGWGNMSQFARDSYSDAYDTTSEGALEAWAQQGERDGFDTLPPAVQLALRRFSNSQGG